VIFILFKKLMKRLFHISVSKFNPNPLDVSQIGLGTKISDDVEFSGYLKNIFIGARVSINKHVTLSCHNKDSYLDIGDGTVIKPYAMLMTYPGGRIRIGKNCSINPFCIIYGHGGIEIGDNVRIATHTVFIPANHNFDSHDMPITEQGLTTKGIKVGNNVWIGAGCTILDGCEIGDGAIIGAGSVVNKDVLPNTVVAGVPNRFIRARE
jgi:acetyltransferase-like isoleucine patch superfamily enzyme